jgi:hypothetical protein
MATGVGIFENDFGNELQVYPNPTEGDLSINLGYPYESIVVKISDINAKLIQSNTFVESQFLHLKLEGIILSPVCQTFPQFMPVGIIGRLTCVSPYD